VIRGQNMNGRWVSGEFAFVSEEKANQLSSNLAYPGDVVFTQRGTLGQVSLVPGEPYDRYVLSQSQMKLAPDPSKADALFLYYVFSSEGQQAYIRRNAAQSGVPHTNLAFLRSTPIRLPIVSEQRAIAGVLGALDDKIELNRRMNETLEALAQLRFESVPRSSSLPLDEVVTLVREAIDPGSAPDEQFEHFSIPAFDDGQMPVVESGSAIKSGKLAVPTGSVLLSKLNPRIPRVWLPDLPGAHRPICSTEFLVALPKERSSREFLYCLFRSSTFVDDFAGRVAGTSGSHQRVKAADALAIRAAVPEPTAVAELTAVLRPLFDRVAANRRESRTLAELRDALLPKLISGELRVRDAQTAAEEAT
jgi:type I restriction enzyme, S subunit